MTTTPEVIELHAVPHPVPRLQRVGFPLQHPYLEQCWAPLVGPSSVLLLRRCAWLWREGEPAKLPLEDLAAQLGLGRGTGRNSPARRTVERVVQFRFAAMPAPGELHVYTEIAPVPAYKLDRLPSWCQTQHERLLGEHLDALARSASPPAVPGPTTPAPHVRMAERLDRLTHQAAANTSSLHR